MTAPTDQEKRRLHDTLAAVVASTQRHAAHILNQLIELRAHHEHYDIDYQDALTTYHRIAKELRNLSRTAEIWGGQR